MIIDISIAVIAIAFAVLVVFLVKVLLAAKDSLDNVSATLKDVQKTMEELTYEVKQTIRTVNDITANVDHKLKQVDPVVDSVNNLGIVLSEVTEVVKELTFKTKEVTGAVFERMKSTGSHHESAENPHGMVKASTPEDRTLQSYAATYGGKQGAWMNVVDIAANIWQRMRKSPSR